MPLFTLIADYGGGTYLHQVGARSAREAASRWPHEPAVQQLARHLGFPIDQFKQKLEAPEISRLHGFHKCWCATARIQGQLLVLHIVETAPPGQR